MHPHILEFDSNYHTTLG